MTRAGFVGWLTLAVLLGWGVGSAVAAAFPWWAAVAVGWLTASVLASPAVLLLWAGRGDRDPYDVRHLYADDTTAQL